MTNTKVRTATAAPWQPIETAPKNEKFVLLFVPNQQLETGPVVMGMHWRDQERDDNGRFKKGRWWHAGDGWLGVEADIRPAWCKPTHWMPLPEPPAEVPVSFAEAKKERDSGWPDMGGC